MEQQPDNLNDIGESRINAQRVLREQGFGRKKKETRDEQIERVEGEVEGKRESPQKRLLRKAIELYKKVNEKAKTFKLETEVDENGKVRVKRGEVSSAKQRIKEDIVKIRVDLEAVKQTLESSDREVFETIEQLKEDLGYLLDQKRKAVFGQVTSPNEFSREYLVDIQKELDEIEKKLNRLNTLPQTATIYRASQLVTYQKELNQLGGIIETDEVKAKLEEVEEKLLTSKPVFLHGPTGTGKTSLAVRASTKLTGFKPYIIACHPDLKQSAIWGKDVIKVEAGVPVSEYLYGPIAKAMLEGRVCVFDEFTALPKESFVFLKSVLTKKVGDTMDVPGNGEITIKKGFQLIFTANLKSDKNRERADLPPEMANEFSQNNIYVGYQSKEETYDITVARLLNKDGSIDISRTDLEANGTIPKLAEALELIQSAYIQPLKTDSLTSLGMGTVAKPLQLEKQVLNQRTIENIISSWKVKTIKGNKPSSFREHLDRALLKEISFAEYSKEDRTLVAKILALYGFLTTITIEDTTDPIVKDILTTSKQLTPTQTKKEKAGDIEHLNIKDIASIDPYGIITRKMNGETDQERREREERERQQAQQGTSLDTIDLESTPEGKEFKETIIRSFKDFYTRHNINIPADFESRASEIYLRNKQEIERQKQMEGYDQILIIPDTLPDTETLNRITTKDYKNPTYQSDNFKNGGSFAGCTPVNPTEQGQFRLVLVHSTQELNDNQTLKETIGKSVDNLTTMVDKSGNKVEGLSLPEYLIFQRYYFDQSTKHLDEIKYTWLPKTKMSNGLFPFGDFLSGSGELRFDAYLPSSAFGNGGCRLSRSYL